MHVLSTARRLTLHTSPIPWLCLSALALGAACSDDGSGGQPDARPPRTDAGIDAQRADNVALAEVSLSPRGALTGPLMPGETVLTASVPLFVQEITVSLTPADPDATLTLDGQPITAGQPSTPISLSDRRSTVLTVEVTAPAGNRQQYELHLDRFEAPQDAYGKAPNASAQDRFGASLAAWGDTLVVGAPGEDSSATGVNGDATSNLAENSGAVYVFRRSGSAWQLEAYLKASNTGAEDEFGSSVAIHDDLLVVGAPGEDSNATNPTGDQTNDSAPGSGAAYVFRREGTTWRAEAYLKPLNTDASDFFGYAVAVHGDRVAVGALFEDGGSPDINGPDNDSVESSGAAYVFARNDGTWAQEAYIKGSSPGVFDQFGTSLALSADTLAVGSPGDDSNATGVGGDASNGDAAGSGAVHVFRLTGAAWAREAYIKAFNTGAGDGFGTSISLDRDALLVGAPGEDSFGGANPDGLDDIAPNAGAAYLLQRSGATWSHDEFFKPFVLTPDGDAFGTSVALYGDLVAVGAPFEDNSATGTDSDEANDSAADSGAVFVYTIDRTNDFGWLPARFVKPSNTNANDQFGIQAVLSQDSLVVGAPLEDSSATAWDGDQADNGAPLSGAIYLF
jgi:hypothetical protein